MRKVLLAVLLAAAAGGGWWLYQQQESTALPDFVFHSNGRLELNRLDVASLYPGRVERVLVAEGDAVKANEVLVELSSAQSSGQLAAAQAATLRAAELVQRARAGVTQAQQAIARADAEIAAYRQQQKVAKLELDNAKQMRREDLVSASELAKRQADFERATASVKVAQAARAEAQAAVAQGQAAVAEAEAGVKQAQAQADTAASADADMAIRSPLTARVEYRLVEPGTVIGAGSRVISLLDPADVSMNVFLPNATVGGLRVGDEARLVLDGIDAVFPAQVSFIASEAQFTPKAVETADEREKLVFRVKLKVPAEVAQRYDRLLKGGMTGDGYVRRDSSQAWPLALEVRLP
ncbi:HlyD family secretion protein [Cardiobacterium hominis]|uniref:HlyD family secretion protein n=1 Tax=Cardiobacterium hominis TaxID=2718 RepID=A0A1C3H3P2_9GAMM|nr:HlyD family efflux transporter periplasmic adaptor subunit [Cardiobacterium hominis]SAM62601.1 HlyD family secretion protein [Cardiobacterium hominis]